MTKGHSFGEDCITEKLWHQWELDSAFSSDFVEKFCYFHELIIERGQPQLQEDHMF